MINKVTTLSLRLNKAWNSTNFWIWVGLFFGTVFVNVGFDELSPIVTQLVNGIFGIISTVLLFRNMIKDKGVKFSWSRLVNGIGYLGLIVNALIPFDIPDALWTGVQEMINYAGSGDWTGFIAALWPVLVIVFNLIRENKKVEPATAIKA